MNLSALLTIKVMSFKLIQIKNFCLVSAPSFLDGSVERAEVTDLYPWLEYQFRIIATNEHGSGEASIPSLKIKTWDAGKDKDFQQFHAGMTLENDLILLSAPVVSPTNVAGYGGRNGEIVITWTVSVHGDGNTR